MNSLFLPPEAAWQHSPSLDVVWVADDQLIECTVDEVAAHLTGPWQLIVPVEAVTAGAVSLPKTRGRWQAQALAFAVEEQLAEDVERLHLALGERLSDGRHRVMAVNRQWLSQWLEQFPVKPKAIYVDADLLPAQGAQLCWSQQRWLLGGESEARVGLSDEDWWVIRDLCGADIHAYGPSDKTLEGVAQYSVLLESERWLAAQTGGCNLAQGEFAQGSKGNLWARFRPLAMVAAVCLGLQVLLNTAQSWYWENAALAYQQASVELYQTLFPQDTRIVNLKAQFDQHLAHRAAGDLLGALQQLADSQSVRVQSLRLDQQGLQIRAFAPSMAELEQAREALLATGLMVEIDAARAQGSGVSAVLKVGDQG